MFVTHTARVALAVAVLFCAGSALAQGGEQAKTGVAGDKPVATKKAPAAKDTAAGRRLDFAPTTPAAATQGVHPAASPSTPGDVKKGSDCHFRDSDA